MSVTAKKWVRKHSPATGTRKAVLSELAFCADEAGRGAYLSTTQLSDSTGLSDSTVKRALRDLEREQMIVRHRGGRDHCKACAAARRGAHVFDVVMPEAVEDADPNQLTLLGGGQPAASVTWGQDVDPGQPDPRSGVRLTPQEDVKDVSPSLDQAGEFSERPELPLLDGDVLPPPAHEGVSASPAAPARAAVARKPVHYRGRKVPKTTVDTAERLLDVFNETTGSGLGARKSDGRPSPALKQVVGALLDREAPAEVWERGVRAMLADPPDWIEDRITVGHLFGPRAAEHTLARGRTDTAAPRRGGRMSASDWGAVAEHLEAREAAA